MLTSPRWYVDKTKNQFKDWFKLWLDIFQRIYVTAQLESWWVS